jgi:hypothetical protein
MERQLGLSKDSVATFKHQAVGDLCYSILLVLFSAGVLKFNAPRRAGVLEILRAVFTSLVESNAVTPPLRALKLIEPPKKCGCKLRLCP